MQVALYWLGLLLILFAIVDAVAGRLFHVDLTGVTWSPIAAGVAGTLLMKFSGAEAEE